MFKDFFLFLKQMIFFIVLFVFKSLKRQNIYKRGEVSGFKSLNRYSLHCNNVFSCQNNICYIFFGCNEMGK